MSAVLVFSRPQLHWQQRLHCTRLRICQTASLLYADHCLVLETEEPRLTEP